MTDNKDLKYSVVISGSFKKFYDEIKLKIREFENRGIKVLSPSFSKIKNKNDDFVILESDDTENLTNIERNHLEAIYNSDALYICNPGGYIGPSTAMEFGWALGFGKPIFLQEISNDTIFNNFDSKIATPSDVFKYLVIRDKNLSKTINRYSTLDQLQKYIEKVIVKRGFDKESTRDIFLLMVEEMGELGKAIRKHTGLKIDTKNKDKYFEVEQEIADIFIYLLDLSNSCKIDLYTAFIKKEEKNEKRKWKEVIF